MNKTIKHTRHDAPLLVHEEYETCSIGMVTRGTKRIHDGTATRVATAGDLFYMPAGAHYIEYLSGNDHPFEQITVHFTSEQLGRTLAALSSDFGMQVAEHAPCPSCRDTKYIVFPAWRTARTYFASLCSYLRSGVLSETVESLKAMELIALVMANPECCLQSRILGDGDANIENFEKVVRANIFTDLTLEELARMTNRSLTAFKSEFRRRFYEPPHRWIIRQRLAHARVLLISTARSVGEICAECAIPNPSHFIRLFGREFGVTPATYRKRHAAGRMVAEEKR